MNYIFDVVWIFKSKIYRFGSFIYTRKTIYINILTLQEQCHDAINMLDPFATLVT